MACDIPSLLGILKKDSQGFWKHRKGILFYNLINDKKFKNMHETNVCLYCSL
jgi:hypothetical protein